MANEKPVITPDTKVGVLLDTFPELEATLIGLSPAFEKLKNPILRKTIARVASLRQVAQVGSISLETLINTLRKTAGQQTYNDEMTTTTNGSIPGWFDSQKIAETLDAREMIERGEHPMGQVLSAAHDLESGRIFELITAFIPAPLIEKVRNQGLESYTTENEGNEFHTYFYKP